MGRKGTMGGREDVQKGRGGERDAMGKSGKRRKGRKGTKGRHVRKGPNGRMGIGWRKGRME